MNLQAIIAELSGVGEFEPVPLHDCIVQRNDWNEFEAYIPALRGMFPVQDNGYVHLTQEQIDRLH